MTAKLTEKQQRFVDAYLVDLNATHAYQDAYQQQDKLPISETVAAAGGARLLRIVKVQQAIQSAQDERSKRTEITVDNVLRELALLGFSDLRNYVITDDGSLTLVPGAPDAAMRAVSSVKRKRRTIPRKDDEPIVEVEVEFRLWSKPDALTLLAKHLGMITEKRELSGKLEVQSFADLMRQAMAHDDTDTDRAGGDTTQPA